MIADPAALAAMIDYCWQSKQLHCFPAIRYLCSNPAPTGEQFEDFFAACLIGICWQHQHFLPAYGDDVTAIEQPLPLSKLSAFVKCGLADCTLQVSRCVDLRDNASNAACIVDFLRSPRNHLNDVRMFLDADRT